MYTAGNNSEFKERLYLLKIGEELNYKGYLYTRVPGGWIVANYPDEAGIAFIPFDNEGMRK